MKSFKLVGAGPRKVMLFPGLLGTRAAFDDMLRWADLDAFQYAAVEYRGYGHARGEPGPLTLREVVSDAVRLADDLGWHRFAVAGHSLGVLAAQMLAVAIPGRVDAIVSIAGTSAHGGSRDSRRQQFLSEAAVSLAKRRKLLDAGTGNRYSAAFVCAVVDSSWDRIDSAAFASYALDASRTDIRAQVSELDKPILVLGRRARRYELGNGRARNHAGLVPRGRPAGVGRCGALPDAGGAGSNHLGAGGLSAAERGG